MAKRTRMLDFAAINVETTSPSRHSICQIGMACFHDGRLPDEWVLYVDPNQAHLQLLG